MTARTRWSLLVGLVALLAAGRASAQTTPCSVDTDCPGTECGSQVCAHDSGGIRCVDQGALGSSGSEGWCADSAGVAQNSNCKCRALGATCEGFLCSFTVPPPTGTGGATGAGGSTGSAGSTGTGGTGTGTGGATGSAGSGGGGGGCSVAGAPSLGGSLGVALLAAALLRRRGRRRV
jgi:hypothetical protein